MEEFLENIKRNFSIIEYNNLVYYITNNNNCTVINTNNISLYYSTTYITEACLKTYSSKNMRVKLKTSKDIDNILSLTHNTSSLTFNLNNNNIGYFLTNCPSGGGGAYCGPNWGNVDCQAPCSTPEDCESKYPIQNYDCYETPICASSTNNDKNTFSKCCPKKIVNNTVYLSASGDRHIDPVIQKFMDKWPNKNWTEVFDLQKPTDTINTCALPQKAVGTCSGFYTWDNLLKAIYLWNKYYSKIDTTKLCSGKPFPDRFLPDNEDINITMKRFAGFLANTYYESATYKSCRERLKVKATSTSEPTCPSIAKYNCSEGYKELYVDGYSKGDRNKNLACKWCVKTMEQDSCFTSRDIKRDDVICKDAWNNDLLAEYCYFGRGAIQITYISNYNIITTLLENIPIIEISSDIVSKHSNLDILANPDLICTNGVVAWLVAIAFMNTTCPGACLPPDAAKLTSACVHPVGAAGDREAAFKRYLRTLGISDS